ncbi:unnamed protein product [Darwinula stevensoni]|uniref:Nudix hydrolase domain-containing protein n=1 Tax=Darwinula stevensoni TaxID=69355 RepID=A0A7R8X6M3_9CRUS|nr:unnamed protein product [Darwinula stevensoni]CAG0881440.1 unnamed protein product [Darwinula stevensoni]
MTERGRTYVTASEKSFKFVLSSRNRERALEALKRIPPLRARTSEKEPSAAVLVPLCTVSDEVSLLYTLRSSDLRLHRGEVSFPGGGRDSNDDNLVTTALRETEEELGIHQNKVDVWGMMPSVPTRKQDSSVAPCIGYIGSIDVPSLKLQIGEVEEAFPVPLWALCEPQNFRYTQYKQAGYSLPVFLGGKHRIWGLTAIITYQVLCVLAPQNFTSRVKFAHRVRI